MCRCCHHHQWWYPYEWPEPYPPARERYPFSLREEGVRRLEEERDLLERRLRRLEQELEELRRPVSPEQE